MTLPPLLPWLANPAAYIRVDIGATFYTGILCWFAPCFPSPLLPFIQRERERESFVSRPLFFDFSLSLSLSLSFPPSEVKSLEASRRGRERRLVTFPSRPLFLRYTHAAESASRTPATHTTHPVAQAQAQAHTRAQVDCIFSLFTPATTLPFAGAGS